ncbi:hypothetical protein [uncultured Prevotella sp.]|uniref:hypothetical protein n=1 Tax=uncultured Prevotella sp. TaxID=159272 RepID=UPI00258F0581|nr:hypothetical protein [uncultured Prevotella sp.]
MKRKTYQKPTMKVVKLEHQCHILFGSDGVGASRCSYGTASTEDGTEETWE